MADKTHIEWTDATWQPITGCSIVSPGCTNCYAMKLAGNRLRHHPSREGLTDVSKAGPIWNGTVRFNEQWLLQPLRWKKSKRIFVCAHGDLFHESVPDEWIDRVFAVMALAPQHTFQVLTKRAERMRQYCTQSTAPGRQFADIGEIARKNKISSEDIKIAWGRLARPLPNAWLGVSAERQQEADERIPLLLRTPAPVRFISAEPLLGPIDLLRIPGGGAFKSATTAIGAITNTGWHQVGLHWVIVGGESGAGARPMHPDWARSLRDQCVAAGVPFFFKQHGSWAPVDEPASEIQEDEEMRNVGGMLDGQYMRRMSKAAAGRLLDGVEHNGMPGAAA